MYKDHNEFFQLQCCWHTWKEYTNRDHLSYFTRSVSGSMDWKYFVQNKCRWGLYLIRQKRLRWSRGSLLAFGTQVRGFKPSRSLRIFQGEKIFSTPSFGREVKPLSHVVDLRHVKDPWMLRGSPAFSGKIHRLFLAQVVPLFTTTVSGGDTWRCK